MKKYRIKTFAEFGYQRPSTWASDGAMDKYYGYVLPETLNKKIEAFKGDGGIIMIDRWAFSIKSKLVLIRSNRKRTIKLKTN